MRVVALLLPLALADPRYYVAQDFNKGTKPCGDSPLCGEDAAPACIRSAAEKDQVEEVLQAYADAQPVDSRWDMYVNIGNRRKAPGASWNTTACPTGPDSNFTFTDLEVAPYNNSNLTYIEMWLAHGALRRIRARSG